MNKRYLFKTSNGGGEQTAKKNDIKYVQFSEGRSVNLAKIATWLNKVLESWEKS